MPENCIACSSYAKFWVKDGSFKKPVCTLHQILYKKSGYETISMTKEERQ